MMLGSELRRLYLDYFESKGAKKLPSDSLVPQDPTLLFTSAGMVQFKPYFLGELAPPASRATTAQKCLRTTDIEDVGDTSHCTFFEMLGNFSFGDYFKAEAIAWAWEFLFDVLQLKLEHVRVTVHEADDEAYGLWVAAGMPERKIFRFDEHSNYWPAGVISLGPNGPCGPCSEIFYDTQPHLPATPDGVWDDKRWLEIWNLVFMQYERADGGALSPLPKRNIDTGMGLERTAAVIAGLRGPFETDLFTPIIRRLEELSGLTYTSQDDNKTDIAFRRVADHVRATAFCLADSVLPSNVGRGYVLRRIMRRAILAGRNALSLDKPFLTDVLPTIIDQRKGDYPDLEARRTAILRYAQIEESQFRRTLEMGSAKLNALLDASPSASEAAGSVPLAVSGDDAFELATTYGFPVEMTQELAAERGASVDMTRFNEKWAQHLIISEGGRQREVYLESIVPALRESGAQTTLFVGYSEPRTHAVVTAIVRDGGLTDSAREGETVQIVLDQTPFYAESGGQVGDAGRLHGDGGEFEVGDTQREGAFWFHRGTVSHGELRVGDAVEAVIDQDRRASIQRNHSTTHLLHKSLQTILGPHVQQRGSLVAPDRLRFDFSHDKGMTGSEIRQVEGLVNEQILDDLEIRTFEKPIVDAKEMGAQMLFGEKYGDIVRVVQMGDFSLEFCGGTHLRHTSQAGLFKIVSETSSQAGVRRIEAVTGKAALLRTLDQERLLSDIAGTLKTNPANALAGVERLQAELRERERELQVLQKAATGSEVEKLAEDARSVDGFKLVRHVVGGSADAENLRVLADELLNRLKSGVVIVGSAGGGKVSLAVKVSKDLVARGAHAGNIVKEAARVAGGGGGGKPEFAQAGGKDPEKLEEALLAAERLVTDQFGG